MEKETALRIKIAEAATKRFIENNRFTIQSLADEMKLKPSQIFDLFPNRSSILRYYYESRLIIYQGQLKNIEDYPDFTLNEKLNNLIQTLIDLFQTEREFVLLTYKPMVAEPCNNSVFGTKFKNALKPIFNADLNIPNSSKPFINSILFQFIYFQFHGLILFWKQDESHHYENTMALIDKWCALVEELFYSKTIDKGFDLAKFLAYTSPLKKIIPSPEGDI